jgi:hypothetical protein
MDEEDLVVDESAPVIDTFEGEARLHRTDIHFMSVLVEGIAVLRQSL